jgi:hypothetical protein
MFRTLAAAPPEDAAAEDEEEEPEPVVAAAELLEELEPAPAGALELVVLELELPQAAIARAAITAPMKVLDMSGFSFSEWVKSSRLRVRCRQGRRLRWRILPVRASVCCRDERDDSRTSA